MHNGIRERLVLFTKGDVNGKNARPVFTYLKNQLPFKDGTTNVLWNFGKFLVDHEGNPVKRFSGSIGLHILLAFVNSVFADELVASAQRIAAGQRRRLA